jgi:uncharacterized membrane protein YqjE
MRRIFETPMMNVRTSREETDSGGIAAQIARVADGLGKLFAEHVTLARLELAEDAKTVGRQAGLVAAFLPFVFIGYALLCVAAAWMLTAWLTPAAAFGLVGGLHFVMGAAGAALAMKKLRARPLMGETVSEFNRSAHLMKTKE